MTEVFELRVHGVGGTPAEGLLGVDGPASLIRVGGDDAAPFMARKQDPQTEGYVWGKLTSKGLLQPLWLFLLPFTLVNVAGWAHRPDADLRGGRWPLSTIRLLVHLVGVSLTATYVVWFAHVAFNRLIRFDKVLFWESLNSKLLLGFSVLAMATGLVFVIARRVQKGFEGFLPPGDLDPRPPPGAIKTLEAVVRRSDDLSSAQFWMRTKQARLLLWIHVGVAVGAAILAMVWAMVHAHPRSGQGLDHRFSQGDVNLDTARLVEWGTWALLGGLLLMALVHLIGWKVWAKDRKMLRLLGPSVPAATGAGLGTGFLYGVNVLVLPGGPGATYPLGAAFGVAAAGWLLGAIVLGLELWVRRDIEHARATMPGNPESVPPNDADPATELTGATGPMYGNIAWARATSNAAQWGGRVLTAVQVLFVATASAELLGILDLSSLLWRRIASFGHYVALTATTGVLYFLIRRAFKPKQRRLVGMLWDVLTFWPRRFHPLGVRPYAERAVPELQHRLVHHKNHMIILSAHSQGSVLAYAALVQEAHVSNDLAARVAFVTYGSPLWQLHAQAFPAYFDRKGFASLRDRLFGSRRDTPTPEPAAWRSFFRRTDYIGKEVFGDATFEKEIPDPATEPRIDNLPPGQTLSSWPDPPRIVWAGLAKHSFYYNEVSFKKWIENLRDWMAGGPGERTERPLTIELDGVTPPQDTRSREAPTSGPAPS